MSNYIISGHSGEIDYENPTFVVPRNVTIIFASNPDTVCYVPQDEKSMNFVYEEMKNILQDY